MIWGLIYRAAVGAGVYLEAAGNYWMFGFRQSVMYLTQIETSCSCSLPRYGRYVLRMCTAGMEELNGRGTTRGFLQIGWGEDLESAFFFLLLPSS